MSYPSMPAHRAFIAFITSLLFLLPSAYAATPRALVAAVERVSDGDTLADLTANGTKLRIRLLGTDTSDNAHGTRTPWRLDRLSSDDHTNVDEFPSMVKGGRPCPRNPQH